MALSVGVLGVGRMGFPISQRLGAAGYTVSVYDPAVASDVDSGASLAASVDVLISVLPGAAEADATLPEVLAALAPGALWVDLTSNDPRIVARLATGRDAVGAPMGGSVTAALAGTLHFYAGGSPAALERARPILEVLGEVEHVGTSVTDGYAAKLLANLLWFGQVVAVAEALLLGQALGLAPATLRATLATSAGGSVFIDEHLDRLLAGDYLETFGIDRVVEELGILSSLAAEHGVPFGLSDTVLRLHREALERFGAVSGELLAAKLLEERAGRTLRG